MSKNRFFDMVQILEGRVKQIFSKIGPLLRYKVFTYPILLFNFVFRFQTTFEKWRFKKSSKIGPGQWEQKIGVFFKTRFLRFSKHRPDWCVFSCF